MHMSIFLNNIASVLYSQVKLKDIKAEEENLPPGLALGCQQHGPHFISWEEREKKGALKAMFSWKKHSTESQLENRKKQMEKSKEKTKKKKSEENPSLKSSTTNWNCEENIDHAVYRILTKGTGKKKIQKKAGGFIQNEGWRGRREEPSEIPTQRKKQVPSVNNSHLINVLLIC